MITRNIQSLLEDLCNHHRNREDIIYEAVSKRLDKSLQSYNDELEDSLKYLKNRKPDRLMRKLNK